MSTKVAVLEIPYGTMPLDSYSDVESLGRALRKSADTSALPEDWKATERWRNVRMLSEEVILESEAFPELPAGARAVTAFLLSQDGHRLVVKPKSAVPHYVLCTCEGGAAAHD